MYIDGRIRIGTYSRDNPEIRFPQGALGRGAPPERRDKC
jgi:hypothetical protein